MIYNSWKWTTNNEKMIKTQRKRKLREIEENIRTSQFNVLKELNNKEINNKEVCAKRLSERQQIKQRVFNPFLCDNNYINDLGVQENFLKPKNSSFECLEQ